MRNKWVLPLLLFFIFSMTWMSSACSESQDDARTNRVKADVEDGVAPPVIEPPTSAATASASDYGQALLVVWGLREWPVGDCLLWIIDPSASQQVKHRVEDATCNYTVAFWDGRRRLISFPAYKPNTKREAAAIVVHALTAEGDLISEDVISVDDIRLTSVPQWRGDDSVFFSGILNGRERIFRFDTQTEEISSYIDSSSEGFSTNPILSPNGRYIAYQVWQNHESKDDCIQLTCSLRFYHIWDIHTGTDMGLLPFIDPFLPGEPYFMHCNLEWSPTSRFVAFEVGCGLQEPSSIVAFDVENRKVIDVVNALSPSEGIVQYEWLSGDRLAIRGNVSSLTTSQDLDGYLLFYPYTQSWRMLDGIPEWNKYDSDKVYLSDWAEDGALVIGQTQAPGEKRTVDLVIVHIEEGSSEAQYLRAPDEFVDSPVLSPADKWIAYRSYNWETRNTKSRFTVINTVGETVFETGMIDVVSPNYGWLLQP